VANYGVWANVVACEEGNKKEGALGYCGMQNSKFQAVADEGCGSI
jgi:hypothetical protein